jgi:small subunit ribosomal protein S16
MGKAKNPFYRIVVSDSRDAVDGKFKEILGYYDPFKKIPMKLDLQKVDSWVAKGAQPTGSAMRLIKLARKSTQTVESEPTMDAVDVVSEGAETEEQTQEDA